VERAQLIGPERIDIDDSLSRRDVQRLAADPALKVVQTAAPVRTKTWALLDEYLFAVRPDVQLRIYGHYGHECDLGITQDVPHVVDFAADSLRRASNIEAIARLPELRALSLGIYELDSFVVLNDLPREMHSLFLGATRSRKPDLAPLARFESLRKVYIEGHIKNLDVLGELSLLEDVTLRSTTTPNLDFVAALSRMWSLDITLGGTTDLSAIRGMAGLKYLELWQIRGLADLSVISDLPGLQNLFLQSLPQVTALPPFDSLRRLRRLVLENMKGIRDLATLQTAPALEEFAYVDARGKDPVLLLPALQHPVVRRVAAGFGSGKKTAEFARLRDEHGKAPLDGIGPFEYR
jgi:hypothetical protein